MDWNGDGIAGNASALSVRIEGVSDGLANSTHVGHDDWTNIVLDFRQFGDSGDGPMNLVEPDEPFPTFREMIAAELSLGFLQPGDADFDKDVDFADLVVLANNFGMQDRDWRDGDFDNDGEVGFSDLVILANNFGT